VLPIGIILGVIASMLIIGLDVFVFQPALLNELGDKADALAQVANPAAWKGFLASFYGGIGEEIQLRLLVMSLIAWLGSFISKTEEGKPTSSVFWIANILAAILFGLGHLPATATILPLTPLVITRAILLNGVGGVIFGWLYWKRGLETAMIAHFSADIVLHVLLAI
ncbi:MAG TPA: CPBP family intramembrane metalloprotease, partial [Anaerolineae bacterium]|nr:CPBP family intramembrane metalloprotease [Anaerolineae bacterium]